MTATHAADLASAEKPAPAGAKEPTAANGQGGNGSAHGESSSEVATSAAEDPGARVQRDWAWGAIVVMAGLLSIVAVFVFAVFQYKTAAEVTTAVGAVSGVIAALVGAYFGIRGASLAQINSESSSTTPKRKT